MPSATTASAITEARRTWVPTVTYAASMNFVARLADTNEVERPGQDGSPRRGDALAKLHRAGELTAIRALPPRNRLQPNCR
jgi:hypothetical protein